MKTFDIDFVSLPTHPTTHVPHAALPDFPNSLSTKFAFYLPMREYPGPSYAAF